MYVQIHLLLLTKVVPRRNEQNLCQSCGKVATKRVFSFYFNVNFMTSERCQFSSDLVEITFIQQRMSLRSYWYQIRALSQLFLQSTDEKELSPSKIDQNQYFFLFSPVCNTKTLIVRKKNNAKMTAIQFPQISWNHEKQKFWVFEKIGKISRGVVTIPPSTPKG